MATQKHMVEMNHTVQVSSSMGAQQDTGATSMAPERVASMEDQNPPDSMEQTSLMPLGRMEGRNLVGSMVGQALTRTARSLLAGMADRAQLKEADMAGQRMPAHKDRAHKEVTADRTLLEEGKTRDTPDKIPLDVKTHMGDQTARLVVMEDRIQRGDMEGNQSQVDTTAWTTTAQVADKTALEDKTVQATVDPKALPPAVVTPSDLP